MDAAPDSGKPDSQASPDSQTPPDGEAPPDAKVPDADATTDRMAMPDISPDDVLLPDGDATTDPVTDPISDVVPDVLPDVVPDGVLPDVVPDGVLPDVMPDGVVSTCGIMPRERFLFSATHPDASQDSCLSIDAGFPGLVHRTVSGAVRSVVHGDAGNDHNIIVTIDTCTGDACSPQNAVFTFNSAIDFTLPVGAFVELDYTITRTWICTYFMRIANLPTWDGRTNPVDNTTKLYFVASDGQHNPNDKTSPIGVGIQTFPIGCMVDAGTCGAPVPADTYYFKIASGGNEITLLMGESKPLVVNGQTLTVRNLRSYQTTFCDDYWNWAFTMTPL